MTQFVEPVPDERSGLLAFLARQRAAVRAALRGLSEEQARAVPTASGLSLAVLVKHLSCAERRWVVAGVAGRPDGLWPVTDWGADFRLDDGETVPVLLDRWAAAAAETEQIVGDIADLGQPCALPDTADWSVRWVLLHLIAETARHAGHADVIRETLDGKRAPDLVS
jgi:Protein of unknown function (DUF664)